MTKDKMRQLIEEIISVDHGAHTIGLYDRNNMIGWNQASRMRFHRLLRLLCKDNGYELSIDKHGYLVLEEAAHDTD